MRHNFNLKTSIYIMVYKIRHTYYSSIRTFMALIPIVLLSTAACAQDVGHLQQSLETVSGVELEISSETAHYKPFFGAGDKDADMLEGTERYGLLTVEPGGSSASVDYGREELIYYVLGGTGTLHYSGESIPISKDDFFYIPINTEHSFSNPRESDLEIMTMGYKIPEDVEVSSDSKVEIASGNDVEFQTLEQNNHGPTSRFQLLMGSTRSPRDKLASAYQMNSLYVIDFDHGGTNIPHTHEREEEIYFVLQGKGEMVAGETEDGEPRKFDVEPGDAFLFTQGSLVGFYSTTEEGEKHARILAVRSKGSNW